MFKVEDGGFKLDGRNFTIPDYYCISDLSNEVLDDDDIYTDDDIHHYSKKEFLTMVDDPKDVDDFKSDIETQYNAWCDRMEAKLND